MRNALVIRTACVVVFVSGCRQQPSRWEAAKEVCGTDGWGIGDAALGDIPAETRIPSAACAARILEDFSVDVEGFLDLESAPEGGVSAYIDGLGDGRGDEYNGIAFVLLGARYLLTHELGYVRDLEDNILVDPSFVKEVNRARPSGRKTFLSEAVYELLCDRIQVLQPATEQQELAGASERTNASWNSTTDSMTLFDGFPVPGFPSLSLMLHEVRHDDGVRHRRLNGMDVDSDTAGAYGWGLAIVGATHQGLTADERSEYQDSLAFYANLEMIQIETFLDSDGQLTERWGRDGFPWPSTQ